jgi:nucleotide-binding universal stress UspA family protein
MSNSAQDKPDAPHVDHAARIVVGVDGSAPSVEALRHGVRLAEALGVRLEAVSVWNNPPVFDAYPPADWSAEGEAREKLSAAADAVFAGKPPSWFSTRTRRGTAAAALIAESDGAEMLVLGSRGHGGFVGLLLGSVSRACAEHAHCPVLIVHYREKPATG